MNPWTVLNVLGISVSIIRIDLSLDFVSCFKLISIPSFLRSFINLLINGFGLLPSCFTTFCLGTGLPLSIIWCSKTLYFFNKFFNTFPRSAMISNNSLVIADLFPKAWNQTLPLISKGKPSIHISLTLFDRFTFSQLGKISFIHIFTVAAVFSAFLLSSFCFSSCSVYFSLFLLKYSCLSRSTIY